MDNCTNFLATLDDNMTESAIWASLLEEERREAISKIPAFIYMTLLIVVGFPGNVIVLIVYYKRFRESTTKCFIMAMAVFDIFSCLIAMPFEIVDIRFDFQLDIDIGCRIMRFFVALFAYGSVLVLIGVAVDRFKRVCHPYSRQMSVKTCKKGIVVIIILAVVFSVPNLIFYGRQTADVRKVILVDCSIDDVFSESMWPKLYFVFQGICWFLAIISLSIMYSFIIYDIKKANKRRQRFNSSSSESANNINTIVSTGNAIGGNATNKRSVSRDNLSGQTTKPNSSNTKAKDRKSANKTTKSSCLEAKTDADTRKKSWQSDGGRSGNRKKNVLARLFSRDVNPIGEQHEDIAQEEEKSPTNDYSSTPGTASLRDEEMPRSRLQDVEEHSGMEDGVSLQQLITLEYSGPEVAENGIDNPCLRDEPDKVPEILHTSVSEGNILNDTHELNKYHKLLSESLQGLNDIDIDLETTTNLKGFQHIGCTQVSTSTDSLSCQSESGNQVNDSAVQLNMGQGDEDGNVPFHRSKSFPGGKGPPCHQTPEKISSVYDGEGHGSLPDKDGDICKNAILEYRNVSTDSVLTSTSQENLSENEKKAESFTKLEVCDQLPLKGNIQDSERENIDGYNSATLNDTTAAHSRNEDNKPTAHKSCLPLSSPTADDVVSKSNRASYQRQTSVSSNRSSCQRQTSVCSNRSSFQRQTSICSSSYEYGYGNNSNMTSSKPVLSKRKQTTVKELKTSKLAMMMFHVTMGFVLSYLPHLSIQIAKIVHPAGVANLMCDETFFGFYHVALRSIFLNHAINPLIYGYYNKRFRQHCASLLFSPLQFLKRSSSSSSNDRTQSFSMEQA